MPVDLFAQTQLVDFYLQLIVALRHYDIPQTTQHLALCRLAVSQFSDCWSVFSVDDTYNLVFLKRISAVFLPGFWRRHSELKLQTR